MEDILKRQITCVTEKWWNETVRDAIMNGEDIGQCKSKMKDKIRKEVEQILAPYIREGSKIVYYIPSTNRYKARIPKPLISQKKPPTYAKTEDEMWTFLHEYLISSSNFVTIKELYKKVYEKDLNDPDLSSLTADKENLTWRKYIEDSEIAAKPISDITATDIYEFYKDITHGKFFILKYSQKTGKSYKEPFSDTETTRAITRKEMSAIKSLINKIFFEAVKSGIIQVNVSKDVDIKRLKFKDVYNGEKVYNEAQREKILKYCLTEMNPDLSYGIAIAFMFCFDMRIAELSALKWADYDRTNGTIDIYREIVLNKIPGQKSFYTEVEHTKIGEGGGRSQYVTELASYILNRAWKICPDKSPSGYIFTNANGRPIRTSKFNKYLHEACDACKIPYYSSHKIRFSAISRLISNGADLMAVMKSSGHKDNKTTMHYVRDVSDKKENQKYWEITFDGGSDLKKALGIK